ncbi:fibronectin type III domain-containing protein [Homoserinibacter sp. YIM 151385]|uniref:fibronectin type III domain-containing protein n=1 Tax=Homoserinibacter sp. YIM 151385 TaxID=2985506 RepID=UPI0022F0F0F6|nr:fibronectin type III domain-containing protein [Homoserinibacter sp. YIM 151385]WBU37747.1 fibronectin type III domain-containing protein [Homoserinibacter sp. YIM 151385]
MPLALPQRALAAIAAVGLLVGGLTLLPAAAASAADGVLDASNSGPTAATSITAQITWAQTFQPTWSSSLTRVDIMAPGVSAVSLQSVSNGSPTGTVLSSGTIGAPAADGWASATFASPAQVTAGAQYAIVFVANGALSVTGDSYPDGNLVYQESSSRWNSYPEYDTSFRTYLGTPPTITGGSFELRRGAVASGVDLAVTPSTATLSLAPGSAALPAGLGFSGHSIVGTPRESVTRTVTVRATNDGITRDAQVTLTVKGIPSAITGVAGEGHDGAVLLTWNAPADAGNGGALTYRVRVTEAESGAAVATITTRGRAIMFVDLDNAKDYRFEVDAHNADVEGWSPSVTAVVAPPAAPSAPRKLAVEEDDERITLRWDAPASDGGSPIVRYEVTLDGGASWTPQTSPLVLSGANGEEIQASVRAHNRSRQSEAVSTAGTPRTVPDAPAISAVSPRDGAVDVAWSAPDWNGGSAITGYLVQHREVDTLTWSGSGRSPASEREAPVTGLQNGVTYEFRVIALNEAGESEASDAETEIPFRAPDAPSLKLTAQGDGTLDFAWSAPEFDGGRAIEGWLLEYRAEGDAGWTGYSEPPLGTTTATVEGLVPGTDYAFRVRAVNEAGAGEGSAPVDARFAVASDAPTELTAVPQDGAVELSWRAPAELGGSDATRYEIVWSWEGVQRSNEMIVVGTTATVEGLRNGTPVIFRVHAITAAGTGDDATVTATPFGVSIELRDAEGEELAELHPGDEFTIADSQLPAGTEVSAELHSTPVALGSATVGADGALAIDTAIPAGAELGRHTVVVELDVPGVGVQTARVPVRITAAPENATAAAGLALTGGDAAPIGLAALLLLGLGAVLTRRTRGALGS